MGAWFEYGWITACVAVALFALVSLVPGSVPASSVTLVMVPLCLWAARLIAAQQRGRITERLRFLGPIALPTTFALTGVETLERERQSWRYWSYYLRELALCVLLWVMFLSGLVLQPALRGGVPGSG